MLHVELPPPLDSLVCTLTSFLDDRHAELLEPLFLGALLAHGRRTATAWFRAAGIGDAFRRAYTLLGTLGRGKVNTFAALLWDRQRCTIDPGAHWLLAIDDTPTPRYGPCVEGAGLHHNPTPGPAGSPFLYGHNWVTLAWVARHPDWHTLALPLRASCTSATPTCPRSTPTAAPTSTPSWTRPRRRSPGPPRSCAAAAGPCGSSSTASTPSVP